MKKPFAFIIALMFLSSGITGVSAQSMAVELEFASADTINLVAGDSVCFQLVAKDSLGNVVTNWSSLGFQVTLTVRYGIAETDTSLRSWSRHADGYTWRRLTVEGHMAMRISPDVYTIDPALFVDGIAHACFTSTAAERDIRLEVGWNAPWASQISPPITFVPAAMDNFLVEITCPNAYTPWTYARRPFEIVVMPRDRYLNTTSESVMTQFTARFPGEFISRPGLSDIFTGDVYVKGMTNYFVVPAVIRQSPQTPQTISCFMPDNPTVSGQSDPFEVLPHPPTDFGLLLPADQHVLNLTSRPDEIRFTWQRPDPPDPYTDIQISRFNPVTSSDSVHYRIHFLDSARTREKIFDAEDMGRTPSFTMTQLDLGLLVNHLAGHAVKSAEILWFVDASDGDFTTASTPISPTVPGHRLRVDNQLFVNRGVVFDPYSISSTSVPVGGGISVDLYTVNMGMPSGVLNGINPDVTLRVLNSTVDTDTSARSWSADPTAYSWSRLTVNGQDIPTFTAHEYTIPETLFTNGRASVTYRSSKAERDLRLVIEPSEQGLDQSSAPLTWNTDTLENFLVEITWPDSSQKAVYYYCGFELVVTPRDRFLNPLPTLVATTLSARFPDELISYAGQYPSPFDPYFTMQGQKTLMLIPTAERDASLLPGQLFEVHHRSMPQIAGSSDALSVIPHAPYPFSLIAPADSAEIILQDPMSTPDIFTWEKPVPPDPNFDRRISILHSQRMSDVIRYEIVFADPADLTRLVVWDSDENGLLPSFTTNHAQLAGVIDLLSGDPMTSSMDVLWYVRATDTLYVTTSNPNELSLVGNRLRITKQGTSAVDRVQPDDLYLSQNYPNPFNPSTTIRFTTTRRGAVSLKIYDLLGRTVATIHQGMLDAGEHTVQFDASALRSGVYVYRLITEGQTLSRRMVVLK